jgi:glutathionylspermidine synthase
VTTDARPDWRSKVEALGLSWHTADEEPYWNETAHYRFTARQAGEIEAATAELYRLFLLAGEHVIRHDLFRHFAIPERAVPLIRAAWETEPPALNHGRFDLAYDGAGPPRLYEFNCDTPTSLLEAAVIQWAWKDERFPDADQFNSLHERLVARWEEIAPRLPSPRVHFAHVADPTGEDAITTAYLADTAALAGLTAMPLTIDDIGWDGLMRRFVDMDGRAIDALCKLYPWEWLARDDFAQFIAETPTVWIEPIWKMIWSNKAILPILWELFPDHPNLLAAHRTPQGDSYAKKPILSREGANVRLIRKGATLAAAGGEYGQEGYVYQALCEPPEFDGVHPVIGSWVVDGAPAGMGIREGGLITGNTARFAPHIIDG